MQRDTRKRKHGDIPISAFSSTLSEKRKRGRPTAIQDNFLLGRLIDWVSLLEESWPEIGWQLLQIRVNPRSTIEDVRKAFRPVKEKPHNPGLAQAFYRETVENASPTEAYRNRVRQGELQGETIRIQAKLTEAERSIGEIEQALKISPPEYADTVLKEITHRREVLAQLQVEINRLANEERDIDRKCSDQEAYVSASELLDFLRSDGRYAIKPRSVAKALAGLPRMRWRQSYVRCSRLPLQQHQKLHYDVLEVILKLWKRRQGESKESLVEYFKTQLPKLPKKLGYTRDFLLESMRDLRLAIEECISHEHQDGEVPYVLTSIFMRNTRSQKNPLERVLANQEKLKNVNLTESLKRRDAKCIYCAGEADSVEHPLPRAIGNFKGYVPLLDRVCSKCNGKLSLLDEQLCRSGIEAFFRKHLEIDGRKQHEKVNPFYRGSAGGQRLEMVGINQATGQDVLLELVGGNEARELRCATLVGEDDSVHVITITDGMTPEQFKERVKDLQIKNGIKKFKSADFSAGPEEMEWVESLMNALTSESRTEWKHSTMGRIVYGPARIKFTVTSRYFRCIAKIGFHYFLTKMPGFRGDEACFEGVREFIANEGDIDKCKPFVNYNQQPLAWQLRNGQRLSTWGHILCAEIDYMQFRAKVQLFAGPEVQPNVYTVQLGRNPSRIDYSEAYGDFFAYYPKEDRGEFDGETSELIGTKRFV